MADMLDLDIITSKLASSLSSIAKGASTWHGKRKMGLLQMTDEPYTIYNLYNDCIIAMYPKGTWGFKGPPCIGNPYFSKPGTEIFAMKRS